MTPDPHKLVQAIAVKPSTHRDTICAVALASTRAFLTPHNRSCWHEWLKASMTKSVRRATKPAALAACRADPLVTATAKVGEAQAFAYLPMPYEDFPKHLSRLQVSGLNIADEPSGISLDDRALFVEINAELDMTTGKTAAQVAHALVLWSLEAPQAVLDRFWAAPSLHLRYCDFDDPEEPGDIVIHDNGLTEVAPGSATVRIPRAARW